MEDEYNNDSNDNGMIALLLLLVVVGVGLLSITNRSSRPKTN